MKIAVGSDHAGYEMKEKIITYLEKAGHEVKNFGAHSAESSDYPDFAHPLSEAVEKKEFEMGVLVCGSGIGVSVTANKHQGIRAALCWNTEIAGLSRKHNNANVICLPSRFVSDQEAYDMVDTFLTTEFEAGRHATRVGKISCS